MQFNHCTALLCVHVRKISRVGYIIPPVAFRIMKITAFILLVCSLQLSAKTSAQEPITVKAKGASLASVLKEIQRQTGYNFFLSEETIKNSKPIDIDVVRATLKQVLDICFKNQPFTYSINENIITIIPKKKEGISNEVVTPDLNGIDVMGKVYDKDGTVLQGASVQVKGTDRSTLTNSKGEFFLKDLNDNSVLIITSIGHETEIIPVNGRTSINVVLKIKVASMDEIQVIGYGTTTRRLSTGNVSSVKSNEIEKQPVQNPLLALQGRVPGLFITQNSGISGSSIKVRIQGQNSIASGNEPLYVIDGVPILPLLPQTGIDRVISPLGPNYSSSGNPLSYINPSDIESIEILKDADATAIFGSRGANGVILITTKKGKEGPMRLDINLQVGFGQVATKIDMLNTRQYLDMRYEAFRNDGINWKDPSVSANDLKIWDTTRYTNWQKQLIGGTANYTNVNAVVSGGTSTVRYMIGSAYQKATTVFPFPNDFADVKGSVHFNINANSLSQKFKLQFSGNYLYDRNQLPRTDLTQAALLLEPNAPAPFNADGSINWAPDATGTSTYASNPMLGIYTKYQNKTYNLISNLVLSYKILPGLEVTNSMGYNKLETNDYTPSPLIAERPEGRSTIKRSAAYGNRDVISWIMEPQASYTKSVNKSKFEILVGGTILNLKINSGYLYGIGYLSDDMLQSINAASTIVTGVSSISDYRYNAIFGRVNYNWDDKYILNLTARKDGSSRFGEANLFHNFGAIGGAWIFSDENIVKKNFHLLSFGKLKASYGTTGSDQIGDYSFMSLYNLYPVPYQGTTGLIPAGLPNPHLQWEETKKFQIGMDLSFWQNRLFLNVTYVRNRSSNQLLAYELPSVTGFSGYRVNFPATIQNRNWECSFRYTTINNKNFKWSINFNLTIPQNKLTDFPNLSSSSYSNLLVIGESTSIRKTLHVIGIDPTTGNYMFASKVDPFNPKFPDDYSELKNTAPKYYGGLQNNITFKRFEIDFLFQFVKQTGYNDALFWNGSFYPGNFYSGYSNQPVTVLKRWQNPGDNASIKKFSTNADAFMLVSDYRFCDASYVRLKNVALSWIFPEKMVKKMHLRSSKIFFHGQNVLTITNYKGLDPENQYVLTPSLPPLRVFTAGIQLGL
jgi:TonB-dependent starch-binding outer membrane protein SusC